MSEDGPWGGGRLAAHTLEQAGVKILFGLCGGHVAEILDACMETDIRIVDTRHEQAAVHMAEGWARSTGRPGVALVTAGPGVVNAFPGMAVAWQSGSPLVLVAGRSSLARRDLGAMQDMDQVEAMRPVSKWARSVYQAHRIPEYLGWALQQALSGRPGPVFLEIPVDILEQEVPAEEVAWPAEAGCAAAPGGDAGTLERAAEVLTAARRPLVIAGGGLWWSGAGEVFQTFVESTGIPFYTRSHARGLIADDHPLSGGFFPAALMQADAALILGTRLDWTIGYGRPPLFPPELKIVQVDIHAAEIGRNRGVEVGITGDVGAVLSRLHSLVKGRCRLDPAWVTTVKSLAQAVKAQFAGQVPESPVHPAALCWELDRALGEDALLVVDGGDVALFANMLMKGRGPGAFTWVGGFGHLGVGLPYAMAAKLAHPERPVVLLCGDGSAGFSLAEFDTAVRHGIPVVAVVSNDAGWGQIKRGQIRKHGRERVVASELGWQAYDRVVEAMGGYGEEVQSSRDLAAALNRAFGSGKPACLNVRVGPEPPAPGMEFPWPIT